MTYKESTEERENRIIYANLIETAKPIVRLWLKNHSYKMTLEEHHEMGEMVIDFIHAMEEMAQTAPEMFPGGDGQPINEDEIRAALDQPADEEAILDDQTNILAEQLIYFWVGSVMDSPPFETVPDHDADHLHTITSMFAKDRFDLGLLAPLLEQKLPHDIKIKS